MTLRGVYYIKIILAIFLVKTRPDKTIFSALTNLTIDFDAESAVFTSSCFQNTFVEEFRQSGGGQNSNVVASASHLAWQHAFKLIIVESGFPTR